MDVGFKQPIIGLCGGIGAGKSRVAAEFEQLGCLVIHDDELNHEVLRRPDVRDTLRQWWGPEVIGPGGEPDRKRIAGIVFADPVEKQRLEGLVFPLIARRRADMMAAVKDRPAIKAIVIDSPLLFESHLDRECDSIVYVEASTVQRLRRLRQARGWNTEELRRRERWQTPLDEKRSHAEFVVDNDGVVERLGPQVAVILQAIIARHPAPE